MKKRNILQENWMIISRLLELNLNLINPLDFEIYWLNFSLSLIILAYRKRTSQNCLYKKKLSVSKATCPESVFKAVQIILWETPVTNFSRKVFKNVNLVRVMPLITNLASFFNNKIFLKNSGRFVCKNFFMFFRLSGFLFTMNSKYFFESWCCILDYFILNCKLWDKFLNSMINLILIISYILMFYRNFE